MPRIALFAVFCISASIATAEEPPSGDSTMYLIGITVKDAFVAADGGEKTKIIASPNIATAENREAVFRAGGQTKVADESVRSGTMLKVKVKKVDGNKVRVSGMLEVSSLALPSDEFVERIAAEYYFARTVSIAEEVCLAKRQTAEGYRIVELTCDKIDPLEPVGASQRPAAGAATTWCAIKAD